MTPLSRLRAFARTERLSQTALAARLGVRRDQLTVVTLGLKPPTRDLAERIEEATTAAAGGPIRVRHWPELRGEAAR